MRKDFKVKTKAETVSLRKYLQYCGKPKPRGLRQRQGWPKMEARFPLLLESPGFFYLKFPGPGNY